MTFLNIKLMTALIATIFATTACKAALPEIPEDYQGSQIWKASRLDTIHEFQKDPTKTIPALAEMLVQLKTLGYRACPERDEIVAMVETTLLSISGHAKYYQDKIEWLRTQALVDVKRSDDEIRQMRADKTMVELGDYESFRKKAFPVLGLLPSSETVAVLGHFLNDPEGMDGRDLSGEARFGSDYMPFPINAEASVIAINKLRIENPPFQSAGQKEDYNFVREGEIDAWKAWWNEVKDGKRTYRFIGSNVEYGPDGPISRSSPQQPETDRKNNAVRPPQETNSVKLLSIAGILAACCLCVAAVWYYLRSAGRRSS